jgi:hypothetical protein
MALSAVISDSVLGPCARRRAFLAPDRHRGGIVGWGAGPLSILVS